MCFFHPKTSNSGRHKSNIHTSHLWFTPPKRRDTSNPNDCRRRQTGIQRWSKLTGGIPVEHHFFNKQCHIRQKNNARFATADINKLLAESHEKNPVHVYSTQIFYARNKRGIRYNRNFKQHQCIYWNTKRNVRDKWCRNPIIQLSSQKLSTAWTPSRKYILPACGNTKQEKQHSHFVAKISESSIIQQMICTTYSTHSKQNMRYRLITRVILILA